MSRKKHPRGVEAATDLAMGMMYPDQHLPAMPGRLVLDAQTELHDRLAYPDERYEYFMQGFAEDARGKGTALAGTPDGAERTPTANLAEAMFFPYPVWESMDAAGAWMRQVGRDLNNATPYQVTADIVDLVSSLYRNSKGIFHLKSEELPSPSGFVWLDKGLDFTDWRGHKVTERAISWGPATMRWRDAKTGRTGTDPAIRFCSWTHIDDVNDYIDKGFWYDELNERHLDGPATIQQVKEGLASYGKLTLSHTAVIMFGERHSWDTGPSGFGDSTLAWLHALFIFMGTEVVATPKAHIDRHTKRRALRSIKQNEVSIITLRRTVRPPGEDVEYDPAQIDWSCQWLVQGHWRHLENYQGLGIQTHHAQPGGHMGDRTLCEHCAAKITWIPPYIKGPDGLPFRATKKLYRISR